MHRHIIFKVEGLAPRKDSSDSIWCKQIQLIKILREKATIAMKGSNLFVSDVEVRITMHMKNSGVDFKGDLDNFIGGILDSLIRCPLTKEEAKKYCWDPGTYESYRKPVCFKDDDQVKRLTAEIKEPLEREFYEVEIFEYDCCVDSQ